MRTKTTLVAVKLTPGELAGLDQLVKHIFETRSEALLEAIKLLFDRYNLDRATRMQIRSERIMHAQRKGKSVKEAKPAADPEYEA